MSSKKTKNNEQELESAGLQQVTEQIIIEQFELEDFEITYDASVWKLEDIDRELVSTYTEHDNPDYKRGMFINTQCRGNNVHSYHEMNQLLRELNAKYPSDTQLFSAGKSEGYGSPDNALDVVGIHIFATDEPKQTAFFVGGHHPNEWSGSETVYLVAERLLQSYHGGNPNAHRMRKNTDIVFIPQVDVDLYAQPDFEKVTKSNYPEFFERGYSRLEANPDAVDINSYRSQHIIDFLLGGFVLNQTRAVKGFCRDVIARYGSPFLAFDYHEDQKLEKFEISQHRARAPPDHPLYVYTEVVKSYPVINESELAYVQELDKELVLTPDIANCFSEYIACKGAYGFTFEVPKEENGYSLKQRIEMNLIATDRVLARHYLDI